MLRILSSMLLLALGCAASGQSNSPSVEARGVWLHLSDFSADAEQGKVQVRKAVKRLADANFNLILPWVVSEYVAALTDTNYLQIAPNAKWDALGELVREAHERGLKVHLWYSFTYYKSPRSPEFDPKHGGSPEWAARSLTAFNGKTNLMTDVCSTRGESRLWELKLIESLLNRYPDISGVHIEEPGYGYPESCVCERCRLLFGKYGKDLEKVINTLLAEDFRCQGTSLFIEELRKRMDKRNPKPILSVNGGPFWKNDRSLGRDWKHWAEVGLLDYYASQNYSSDFDTFKSYTQTILSDLPNTCPVFVGIGIKWSGGETPLPVALQQVDYARSRGAKGILFFSAKSLTDDYLNALKAGPFKTPAAYPAR